MKLVLEMKYSPKYSLLVLPIATFSLLSSVMLPANAVKVPSGNASQPTQQELAEATDSQRAAYFQSVKLLEETRQETAQPQNQNVSTLQAVAYGYGDSGGATIVEVAKCAVIVGPVDCNTAKNDADTASAEAANLYPAGTLHNGTGDAFRHCYWNALMTIHINPDQAKKVADQHEDSSSGPENEKIMDRKNNEVGREIGKNSADVNAAKEGCQTAVTDGRLQVSL